MKFSLTVVSALFALKSTLAVNQLTIKGSKFFDSVTGQQFYFKGIDYQPEKGAPEGDLDPLADSTGCTRDAAVFKDLGVNSIRVYQTDYSRNHDACMKTFNDAGIYVLIDIPTPKYSIDRSNPSWNTELLNMYKLKVDAFINYQNLAGFIIGNEVANDVPTTASAAFVKAALRDIKTYIRSKKKNIPVGYVDNDDLDIRLSLIAYFNCGSDPMAQADFYGVNTYRWCGANATFKSSGYDQMAEPFKNYSVPSIVTEYGCNVVQPRSLGEMGSIYGPDLQDIMSGGFLYQYSQEDNNYGIVDVSYGKSAVTKLDDYAVFKKNMAAANPKGTTMNSYNPSLKTSSCPSVSSTWMSSSTLPPPPSESVCSCMVKSLSCVVGSSYSTDDTGMVNALSNSASTICGLTSCADVTADSKNGTYGPYSYCSSTQRLQWIINKNYLNQNKNSSACKITGAPLNVVSPSQSNINSCPNSSSSSVTDAPTAPSGTKPGGSSNSGGSSSSDGSSSQSGTTGSAQSLILNHTAAFILVLLCSFSLF
ncbi:pH-responsive protein 1 [Zancudomyces culisetae]|uniref:1,3-beta-glucanosyltransferase n=1 Tax=Zancudomyces culisetae TaxID=1213189 RepID=A0A1R1PU87_ZANCU|nr:pH-responsive protein 1 [Zancudomyces culisetae]OMH82684.1 pH-responsive protein 1 [Zancudomyces culisetae]OMH84528.1 pH-responsive protein 1 [Zancudomyces culisetae]|eukprot:OMH79389.1 pH-responsive protein 1 [Zancudomyces culisetae]